MPLRRRAAVLAVTAAVSALSALSVPAATADTATPSGLYGAGDPTYDGVWRQSYALLALRTAGVNPAAAAVGWLTGQQCADGGFPSYRKDTAVACDPKREDTNATGIAVQALAALGGHSAATTKAVAWLATVQNADGGWSYNPGGGSDPDSTGVVMGALKAVGKDPAATAKGGKTAYDALRTFQFGCAAKPADRGAFGYPMNGKLSVNAKATADAVRGAQGATFVVAAPPVDIAVKVPECVTATDAAPATPADAANAGAAYLTTQLTAGGNHLTAVTPGADKPTADYGTTADAVIALAAGGHLTAAKSAYTWLAANSAAWSRGNPAALSQLVLAAHATGDDPRAAGGADLVQQLTNLGPAPATSPSATPAKKKDSKKSSTAGTLLIVGVFFVASIGFGLYLSARKRRHL
jgi:hypothetical protein